MNVENRIWNLVNEVTSGGPVILKPTPLLFQLLENGFFSACASLLFWLKTGDKLDKDPRNPKVIYSWELLMVTAKWKKKK